MSLTGAPLILSALLGTAATLAATVLVWLRARRLRVLSRTLAVLLSEALLLLSVGLVVNRWQEFYPTWAALLQTASTSGTTYATAPGRLDRWLRAYNGAHPDQSAAITWQPTGWAGWHLSGAPTVVTPTAYLRHPTWRYSTVLVLDQGTGGWNPATEVTAARDADLIAGAAIMVFARTTPATTARTLGTVLPSALAGDLRVTGRRWALVASTSDAELARRTAAAVPARYPAIAVVRDARPPNARKTNQAVAAGIAVADFSTSTKPPPLSLAAGAASGLSAALVWACQQTPPPLAASTPPVTYLPPHRGKRHHRARPGASAPATIEPGGSRGPGQSDR